ncbi:GAF domain-containing protein [Dyadobacter sp. LJ53]|uniref:GAF domain-containing protein n=1 Tax=Dyadobacter chenwenxiniae TaxID=2906456 RepID=UPI001F3CBDA8|nr:GAF domain-containing protein [Dyadobacter chenwenxiniae]MCF0049218.1 GAF domain-containing protein [Dyadobacter chenwenxiniae]
MKVKILDFSGLQTQELDVDAAISFMPFIRFVAQRAAEETTPKAVFYNQILACFQQYNIPATDIPIEDIGQYERFLEHIYSSVSPVLALEKEVVWALSFPLNPKIFYGTDLFYEMLAQKPLDEGNIDKKSPAEFAKERLRVIYALIMQRLYDFQVPSKIQQYYTWTNPETGLLRYFEVFVNTDFVEITPKSELPVLDFSELYARFSEENGHLLLENVLPLSLFKFRGFSVLTVSDITSRTAVENIRKIRLNRIPGQEAERYHNIIHSLKTLVQNNRIEFDMFPFVRVNKRAVYGYETAGTGIMFRVWGQDRLTPEAFSKQAESYAAKPISFYSPDIGGAKEMQIAFLEPFRKEGVRSLALLPVFFDEILVGVLCMHTWQDEVFDEKILSMLEPAFEPVGQLLQIYIDEFNLELENIIKEKFTSIQPSVQWKFNEAAWHYLHKKKRKLPVETEPITFQKVYPLYGAIDIRNSTLERNAAITKDLNTHLTLLSDTLATLQRWDNSSLMQEFSYTCKKWLGALESEGWSSAGENNLNHFLSLESRDYLSHLADQHPETSPIIAAYLNATQLETGEVFSNRRAFEASMKMINDAVNDYFEIEKDKLQQPFPCYFEKFRTDGVEYDIYIGQSISPEKPFNNFHLKNLRLWQLSSMIAIAKTTKALSADMPKALSTTQLIFIHNHMIDISFRADERKFDVEGAYNIRYQMIKKRIDKVHIRNTNERLTQPDKIALIFFNDRDIEDYLPFIRFLQETNALTSETERLELEDLQGLSGLHALRLGIVF